jgi:hypothetical protein
VRDDCVYTYSGQSSSEAAQESEDGDGESHLELLICVTFGEVQRRINKGCRIGKKGAPLFCSDRWGKRSGCSKVAAVALSRIGRRELNV